MARNRHKKRKYCRLSNAERAEVWKRWRSGQFMAHIARALALNERAITAHVRATGGISPPVRRRHPRHLTAAEREVISRGLAMRLSCRRIAAELGRSPSTVSRELARNGGARRYRCVKAENRAWKRARRPKRCKLAINDRLRRFVAARLEGFWSPQQIAEWLKRRSSDLDMQISHETIYRSLFIQARNVLKKDLQKCLRTRRVMRHGRGGSNAHRRTTIPDAISIRERPADVEDRAVPGHWEGDLLAGTQTTFIATLVERATRFTMLVKVDSRETATVIDALVRHARKLPTELQKSLTLDRGSEFAQHARFTMATDMKVYFCDPHSPWQRGSNENTNGLLRQYFPKGQDISKHSQAELNRVARQLNSRPRQTLDFRTPAEVLNDVLR